MTDPTNNQPEPTERASWDVLVYDWESRRLAVSQTPAGVLVQRVPSPGKPLVKVLELDRHNAILFADAIKLAATVEEDS